MLLARRGLPYDRAGLKPLMTGLAAQQSLQAMIDFLKLEESADDLVVERYEIYWSLLPQHLRLVDGFERFHRTVSDTRPTAVATSMSPKTVDIVDQLVGIRARFSGNVYTVSDAGGKSKPDPAVFLHAASKIGVNPADCLAIEDSIAGLTAIKSAGMFAVGLAGTFPREVLTRHADLVVNSYAELTEHLKL